MLIKSLPPLIALPVAFILKSAGINGGEYILLACVIYGLYPLVAQIWRELHTNKRIDIGLPVVFTILLLIYLGQLNTAGIFVFLILIGGLFKDYIIWRVKKSVEDISAGLPSTALIKQGEKTVEIKITEIEKGQIITLKSGSRAPVDGLLLYNSAQFDESVVTGESKPVEKKNGSVIIAGSINTGDYAEMSATDTSVDSTIAQVKKMVKEAQAKSAPLSKFTNTYSQATIAVTLILCGIYYLISQDILQVIALWIALVPVIFAIIVPVSTTLGISILSRRGILIKSAEAVENMTKINTVVFDKTGTLTNGHPTVSEILPAYGFEIKDILRIAASVEKYSEHNMGGAIVNKAENEKIEIISASEYKAEKGRGVEALCDGKRIRLGNAEYIASAGINIDENYISKTKIFEESGISAVFMSVNGKFAGIFLIEDTVRNNAREIVADLKRIGCKIIMLTGDSNAVATKIAKDLNIDEVHAECLPADKMNFLSELKKSGRKIAMIGDGINDAPALAAADVGIAMGLHGVDLTLESASAVLINNDLAVLPKSILSSRKIFKTIKTDLIIATAIHLITAALVVNGNVGILGSALFHQLSSTLVLLNTSSLFRLQN